MAVRQIKNILVGVGTMEVSGNFDQTLNSGNGGYVTDFADLGYTVNGVEVTFEPDMVDIKVDQLGDAAKIIEQSTKVMMKTTLAEATLEHLALAWGYKDGAVTGTTTKTFKLGVFFDAIPTERKLRFTGKSPDGLARVYTCNRVLSVSASGHSYKRGEATLFPVEFRILPDATQTGAEYGTIVDTLLS